MNILDAIVSGVAAIIAVAFLLAGSTRPAPAPNLQIDAGCAENLVQELIKQKSKLREIASQSRKARSLAEKLVIQETERND